MAIENPNRAVASDTATAAPTRRINPQVWRDLPNLMATIRDYRDDQTPVINMLGFGSSIGLGQTLVDPTVDAPPMVWGKRVKDVLGTPYSNIVTTNRSVSGTRYDDFAGRYNTAVVTDNINAKCIFLVYGMNDGKPAYYNGGQKFDQMYGLMKTTIQLALSQNRDVVVCTTPHPHSVNCESVGYWADMDSNPITYPQADVPTPGFGILNSVRNIDVFGEGTTVPVSHRHFRVNQVQRYVAAELGCGLVDAEQAHWRYGVIPHGENALFNDNAHLNELGHAMSFGKAIDAYLLSN